MRKSPRSISDTMSVRSVRLPDRLWEDLGKALDRANVGRRRPILLSALIRGLLERGIKDESSLEEIASYVPRPARVLHESKRENEKYDEHPRTLTEQASRVPECEAIGDGACPSDLAQAVQQRLKASRISFAVFRKQVVNTTKLEPGLKELVEASIYDVFLARVTDRPFPDTAVRLLKEWIARCGIDDPGG